MDSLNDYEHIINSCWIKKENRIFYVPFSMLQYYDDLRILQWECFNIKRYLQWEIDCICQICCAEKRIIFYIRDDTMTAKYLVAIPYESRSNYKEFIVDVNALVPINGVSQIFVNNNPYHLEALLYIETAGNVEQIEALIAKYKLARIYDKGYEELFNEIAGRGWNTMPLACNITLEEIELCFNNLFIFAEQERLAKLGYSNKQHLKKKMFISYCHADKKIVLDIVELLERMGLNVWIDKKDISVGDNILEKVVSGIAESDLAILFLSKNTLMAHYPKFELKTIMSQMIYQSKSWYLIKLDDVDVNQIFPSVGQYLYYDFSQNANIEMLAKDIEKKVLSLK